MKKSTCLAGALALGLVLPAAGLGTSLVAASGANAQNVASGQTGGSVAFVREAAMPGGSRSKAAVSRWNGPSMSGCAAMPARRSRTPTR